MDTSFHTSKHSLLNATDVDVIRVFLQAWTNYKTTGLLSMYDCISTNARTAIELVYADRLYRNELLRSDDYLEPFLRSIVPASTLYDIQPYFDVNVTMSLTSQDIYHAHAIAAYNLYWNKFFAAFTLFKPYFDSKQKPNLRGAVKLIQLFFVRGL